VRAFPDGNGNRGQNQTLPPRSALRSPAPRDRYYSSAVWRLRGASRDPEMEANVPRKRCRSDGTLDRIDAITNWTSSSVALCPYMRVSLRVYSMQDTARDQASESCRLDAAIQVRTAPRRSHEHTQTCLLNNYIRPKRWNIQIAGEAAKLRWKRARGGIEVSITSDLRSTSQPETLRI